MPQHRTEGQCPSHDFGQVDFTDPIAIPVRNVSSEVHEDRAKGEATGEWAPEG